MMREDREKLGISIQARHFDINEVQARADAQERENISKSTIEENSK